MPRLRRLPRLAFAALDGAITAAAIALVVAALGAWRGASAAQTGGRLFTVGAGLMVLAGLVGAARSDPPRGILARLAPHSAAAPLRAYRSWLDRWITIDNAWFLAGAALVGVSFLSALWAAP